MYTKNIGWWIIATASGLFLAEFAPIIPLYDSIPVYTWFPRSIETIKNNSMVYFFQGEIRGIMFSLPQWLVLRRIVPNSWIWILAVTAGWGIYWIMFHMGNIWFSWWSLRLSIGISYGLITGPIMFLLLRQPSKNMQENEATPIV
jgi:hypothetical protein